MEATLEALAVVVVVVASSSSSSSVVGPEAASRASLAVSRSVSALFLLLRFFFSPGVSVGRLAGWLVGQMEFVVFLISYMT